MIERIRDFQRFVAERVSDRNVPTRHGVARLVDVFPAVYDANYLSVEGAAAPAAVLAEEAESVMEHCPHRRLSVEGGGAGLADELAMLGFDLSTHLVLAHRREPDRLVDTSVVHEVTLETVEPAHTAATLSEPWGERWIAEQLNGVKRRVVEALPTRFFAAVVGDEIAGYCELRERGGVAQIEDVEVLEPYRGRGLGRAIVQRAVEEGRRSNEVVWLEALADDWPRELYAKLGFDAVDRRDVYTRLPHPLTRLRLRTPRLELRLATVAELRELYRVAEAGIHDRAEMPFGVPWTDTLGEESFLAYHRDTLAAFEAHEWRLNLVAFHGGRPVGSQGLAATDFAHSRTVQTGSWLGREWQGRGLGTEMRAGILVLAFDGLGAERAESGAFAHNLQSLGVSRRLGYTAVGTRMLAPRGVPAEHVDLELRRGSFTSPVAVELEGLEHVRALFG
jgi:RimJ/RimL family protein N-acetyltransferase/GNAT superfamily N-acetyltransferase